MTVLSDSAIRGRLAATPPILTGVDIGSHGNVSSKIQPCSVDLAIGEISLPVAEPYEKSDNLRCSSHTLGVGACVRIFTAERLNLIGPHRQIAGFVHAPARLTRKGLLMLDIAHVDPGFTGMLSFTVINVGAQEIHLSVGNLIATLIFFDVSPEVEIDYSQLKPDEKTYLGAADDIKCLAPDLLDIKKQAEGVARKVYAEKDSLKNKFVEAFIGAIVGAVLGVLGGYVGYTVWFQTQMNDRIRESYDLTRKVETLNSTIEELKNGLDQNRLSSPKIPVAPVLGHQAP
jgi:deoxycytidine triphosphate deaminase